MIDRLDRLFTRLSAALAVLGGLGLVVATVITCTSILLRLGGRIVAAIQGSVPDSLLWLRPILGEEEIVSFGVGFALFAAMPWVMINKGHIRVDLFEPVFNRHFNRLLDLLGDIALTVVAWLLMTRQWYLVFRPARRSEQSMLSELLGGNWAVLGERLRDNQESQILGLELWPLHAVAEACMVAFFGVALFCVLRSARDLFRPATVDAQ